MEASSKHLSNQGLSRPLSSSLPIFPTSREGAYPKLTDSQPGLTENGLTKSPIVQATQLTSNNGGAIGHLFSSDFHPQAKNPSNAPFLSQETDPSWCPDSLPSFFDFSPVQNNQVVNNSFSNVIESEEFTKRDAWPEWADQLLSDDDALTSKWNELLADTGVADMAPKMAYQVPQPQAGQQLPQAGQQLPQTGQQLPQAGQQLPATTKTRMRWSPDLHEAFVEAVNRLGGSERATPKGVLKLMKVEGLTIYHVKSHLQKYRTARYIPDSSEASSEKRLTTLEDISSLDFKTGLELTEALRLQMEVQKKLHEHLEIQRNLQSRIEEQGKYLEKMFEKQYQSGDSILKSSEDQNEKQKPAHQIESSRNLEQDSTESSPPSAKRPRTD